MASRLIDNIIALKLLKMLVTPFDHTEAFKLGIIDAKGKVLRPASTLKTDAERNAYDYLDRLVFNVKRLINKLPGGESQLKNLTAAYFMVKEKYEGKTSYINEKQFTALVERLQRVTLVEEEILVEKMLNQLSEDGEGGGVPGSPAPTTVPANHTGAAVSTDKPKIFPKDIKKYKKKNIGAVTMIRRTVPLQVGSN